MRPGTKCIAVLALLVVATCPIGASSAATYTTVNNAGTFTWNGAPWTAGIPDTDPEVGLLQGGGTITIDGSSTGTTPGGMLIGWNGNFNMSMTGGTLTVGNTQADGSSVFGLTVGESGAGTFTQSGGKVTSPLVWLGRFGATSTGVYTLSGTGELETGQLQRRAGSAGTLNLNGGTLRATAGGAGWVGANITVNVQAGGATLDTQGFDVTVNSALLDGGGGGGLTKLGSGTLSLLANNTYTGLTTVSGGTLQIGAGGATGSLAGNVTISTGATLAFNRTGGLAVSGNLTGAGALDITLPDGNQIVLSGSNNYSGGTTVRAGFVALGADNALGTGVLTFNAPSLRASLNMNGHNQTLRGLADASATTYRGDIYNNDTNPTSTLTLDVPNGETYTYANQLGPDAGWRDIALVKNGLGKQILTGANLHTGGTTVNAGTLVVSNSTGSGTGSGAVTINGGSLQIGEGGTTGSIAGNVTLTSPGNLTFYRSDAITYAGAISGDGGLTQSGAGTLALSANNTAFTGTSTVSAGVLQIGAGGATGSIAGPVVLQNSAALALYRNNRYSWANSVSGAGDLRVKGDSLASVVDFQASANLTYTGDTYLEGGYITCAMNNQFPTTSVLRFVGGASVGRRFDLTDKLQTIAGLQSDPAGDSVNYVYSDHAGASLTLDVPASQSFTYGGILGGTGNNALSVTKSGPGTQVLTGANAYTGGTTVTGGTLSVSADANLGTGPVNFGGAGGTLLITGATAFNSAKGSTLNGPGTIQVDNSAGATFTGALVGASGLTKSGSGLLVLSGANSYTGQTTVSGGTLQIGNNTAMQMPASSAFVLQNGANLVFSLNAYNSSYPATNISGTGNVTFQRQSTGWISTKNVNFTYNGITTVDLTAGSFPNGWLFVEGTGALPNSTILNVLGGYVSLRKAQEVAGLTGSGGTIYRDDGTSVFTVNVPTGNEYSYGGVLGTGLALIKSGAGKQILTGDSTYAGGTTVSDGTLQIGDGGTAGSIVGNAVVTSPGILACNRSDVVTFPGSLTGTGTVAQVGSGTVVLTALNLSAGGLARADNGILQIGSGTGLAPLGNGNYSVASGATLVFTGNSNDTYFTVQSISGAGDVEFRGQQTGYFTFRDATGTPPYVGSLTYTGRTIVNLDDAAGNLSYQGALWLEKDDVLPHATVLDLQSGKVYLRNSQTLGQTVAGLAGGTAATFITTDQTAQKLTLDVPAAQTYVFGGVIGSDGAGNNNIALTKTGPGTQVLSFNNSYTGGTTVSGGTLQLGADATHGWVIGTVTLANGATLAYYRHDNTTLSTGTGLTDITGTGNVSFQGAVNSYYTLQEAWHYTGTTTVNLAEGGWATLFVESNGSLPTTTDVNLLAGNINLRNSQSWKGLAGNAGTFLTWDGGGTGALTLNVDTGKSFAYAGQIRNTAGTMSVAKTGPGTQVLSGACTYSGGTTISDGTLQVDGSIGAVTVNGGWLTGTGSVGALTVNHDGSVSAGHSPGALTVVGNYSQAGTMLAELGGPLQGQAVDGYDWILVSGLATLSPGATIDVNLVGGYHAQEGTKYDILTAAGGITNANLSGITFDFTDAQAGHDTWVASIVDLDGQQGGAQALRLEAVPEPASLILLGLGVAGLVRRARRRRLA